MMSIKGGVVAPVTDSGEVESVAKRVECGCLACTGGMKTGHRIVQQMLENRRLMNNGLILASQPSSTKPPQITGEQTPTVS